MRMRSISCAVALALVLAGGAPAAGKDPAPPTGEIALTRKDVWLHDLATGAERRLTEGLGFDRPLTWSPDGRHLVYWVHPTTGWELWRLDVASGERHRISPERAGGCRSLAYAADGTQVAYWRTHPEGIWVAAPDGRDPARVTTRGHRDQPPVWHPDGRALAFCELESVGERSVRVHLVLAERTAAGAWTVRRLGRGEPRGWSPDGRWVYAEGVGNGSFEVVRFEPATGREENLTNSAADEYGLAVSPGATHLAFVRDGEGDQRHVLVADADGANARPLVTASGRLRGLAWSPDGRHLAYTREVDGQRQLFVLPAAGGTPRQVTTAGAGEFAWRPAP